MFETPLIERFSRVHPSAPFVFWIPILGYCLVEAVLADLGLAIGPAILFGALVWSLVEYLLHRFLFHRISPTWAGRRTYFIAHGVHHDFPTDRGRLVMPLGVSIPIGLSVYLIMRVLAGATWAAPMFVGFGIGYLSYDGIHYATHHFRMTSPLGRYLKRYHMVHHHTGEAARWGVSSPLWDWVFGTMGETKKGTAEVVGS